MVRRILTVCLLVLIVGALPPAPARGDEGAPAPKRTYDSANGLYSLVVDPRWNKDFSSSKPLLTFRRGGKLLWQHGPKFFQDFRFPLDAKLSNNGRWLVFGGSSVHNMSFDSNYRGGLRIYRSDGTLVRFISRRDLPLGQYSVSTEFWYDDERTHIVDSRLIFFTPGRDKPMVFELATGAVVRGHLVRGQGDDGHWRAWLLRSMGKSPPH